MPKRRSNPKSTHVDGTSGNQRQKLTSISESEAPEAEISEAEVSEAMDTSPEPSSPTPGMMSKRRKAAQRLRDFWKLHSNKTSKRLVKRFMEAKITSRHAKEISFEELVLFLREKRVIKLTKDLLQRIHKYSVARHNNSQAQNELGGSVNVRVFLASYMIVNRPTHVFEQMGPLEQELFESAKTLQECFERIVFAVNNGALLSQIPEDVTRPFVPLLCDYLKSFKAWKVPDEAKLTCRIQHALVALYNAQEQLPADEPNDSKLKVEFRTQIQRLRGKLTQIAGPEKLRQLDDSISAKKPIPGIPTPCRGGGTQLQGKITNEHLAHQLLLDSSFQLLDDCSLSEHDYDINTRIRQPFQRAFWDSLADDLSLTNPSYVRSLRVLVEIRDGIVDLVPAGTRISDEVNELMDIPHIEERLKARAFDWGDSKSLIGSIVSIVMRTQHPSRTEKTESEWKKVGKEMLDASVSEQPRAYCNALEFLLNCISKMRVDAANMRLRLIAPVIRDHGVEYERSKFQDKLNDGSVSLGSMQNEVEKAVKRALAMNVVTDEALRVHDKYAFVAAHTVFVLDFITRPHLDLIETFPPTLHLDARLINALHSAFHGIVDDFSLVVLVANDRMGKSARPVKQEILIHLSQLIKEDISLEKFDFKSVTSELFTSLDALKALDEVERGSFSKQVESISDLDDPVRKLIVSRLSEAWLDLLLHGVPMADSGLVKTVGALKQLTPLMDKLMGKFKKMLEINREVHVESYNTLIASAIDALRTDGAATSRAAASPGSQGEGGAGTA